MTTTTTTMTTAATELANSLETAWNEGDGAAFGAVFTEDADFVDIRGDHHEGRASIAAGHQAIFNSVYAGSSVDYRVEAVRPIGDDTAVAIIGATLETPTGPLAGTSRSRITAVLAHVDGTWSIASFHNTLQMKNPQVRT